MSRVSPAPPEQVASIFGDDAPLFAQVYAQSPEIAAAYMEFSRVLRRQRTLPARLVELVRLRIAFHNQCRTCMAGRYGEAYDDGLTEGLLCSLEKPEESTELTEAERAAIAYADLAATDHHAIDDATFDRLREHFSDAEIVELGFHVANYVGFGRMARALHMIDDLPPRFQVGADEVLTPWSEGELTAL